MSNLARDAKLHHYGSHSVRPSHTAVEGIDNEEVFLYFDAIWRGKPVTVTMRADRYSASYYDERTNTSADKLTPWRTYAASAYYGNQDAWADRGDDVSGNARSALSELCKPLVMEWLNSDAYTESYQRAVAKMIMRHFDGEHFRMDRVAESLDKFESVLPKEMSEAIVHARRAYLYYLTFKTKAFAVINGEEN